MPVLRYVANANCRFHTFVANIFAVIREATSMQQWHYVEINLNPAASRGIAVKKILKTRLWIEEPEVLFFDKSEWPMLTENLNILPDGTEIKTICTGE